MIERMKKKEKSHLQIYKSFKSAVRFSEFREAGMYLRDIKVNTLIHLALKIPRKPRFGSHKANTRLIK